MLIEAKTVVKDDHRMFTYEDGKRIPIPDDGVVFCYLSKARMLRTTDYPDRAGAIDGKFVVTDEVKDKNGKPCINGKDYSIWGAGENFVYRTKAKDQKFYTKEQKGAKVQVSHPNKKDEQAACEILREIYTMLI